MRVHNRKEHQEAKTKLYKGKINKAKQSRWYQTEITHINCKVFNQTVLKHTHKKNCNHTY